MQKANYLLVSVISVLTLVCTVLHFNENDLFSKKIKKRFEIVSTVAIISIFIDTLFFYLENYPENIRTFLYILKTMEFILNPIIIYLFFYVFCDNSRFFKKDTPSKIRVVLLVICITNGILQFLSIFWHFAFIIDESNMYQRTMFTYGYAYSLVICILLLVFGAFSFSLRKQNTSIRTIVGFCIIFSFGFVTRLIDKESNFDWLCMSISLLVLVVYYYNLSLRLDSLTQLLNRQVYDHTIECVNYTTIVIMIDANNFKMINDTYGHESGDRTLRLLANLIYKTYGSYAQCFRIGGDEFCCILKPSVYYKLIAETPKCDVYTMTENFMKRLDEAITKFVSTDSEDSEALKYGVSQGYGIYYLPSEYPEIKRPMSFDKVIALADKRMYRNKAKYRRNFCEENPAPLNHNGRVRVVYEPRDPELIESSD